MGLGKTVEVLALVLANRAPDENCEDGEREGSGEEREGSGEEREGRAGEREKKGGNVETEETTSVSNNKPENEQIPGTSCDQPIILEGTQSYEQYCTIKIPSLMSNIAPLRYPVL